MLFKNISVLEAVISEDENAPLINKYFEKERLDCQVLDDKIFSNNSLIVAASYVLNNLKIPYSISESSNFSIENKDIYLSYETSFDYDSSYDMTFPIRNEHASIIQCLSITDVDAPFRSIIKAFHRNIDILMVHCSLGSLVGLLIMLYKFHVRSVSNMKYKSTRRIVVDSIWIVLTIILLKQPKLYNSVSIRLAVGFWKIACFVMVSWLAADVESNAIVRKRLVIDTIHDVTMNPNVKVYIAGGIDLENILKMDKSTIFRGLKSRIEVKSSSELESPQFLKALCKRPSILIHEAAEGRRFIQRMGPEVHNTNRFLIGQEGLMSVSSSFKLSKNISKLAVEKINQRIIRFRETKQDVNGLRKELEHMEKYMLRETVSYKERSLNVKHFPEVFYTWLIVFSLALLMFIFEVAY